MSSYALEGDRERLLKQEDDTKLTVKQLQEDKEIYLENESLLEFENSNTKFSKEYIKTASVIFFVSGPFTNYSSQIYANS